MQEQLEDILRRDYDWNDPETRVLVIRDVLIPPTYQDLIRAFVGALKDLVGRTEVDADSIGIIEDHRAESLEDLRLYFHNRSSWPTLLVLHWSLAAAAEAARSGPDRLALPHAPGELLVRGAELFRRQLVPCGPGIYWLDLSFAR